MQSRVAVLLDGGFVTKRMSSRLGRFPGVNDIRALIRAHLSLPALAHRELLRAFYYDAPPLRETAVNPVDGSRYDFGANPVHHLNLGLQDSLATAADMAVRRGEVVFRGWRLRSSVTKDLIRAPRRLTALDIGPVVEQKGVDLRIGLDVAALAVKGLVDSIVLVSGDSDLVPAMKFARREGLRVLLDTLGHGVRRSMREHSDLVFDGLEVGKNAERA